MPACSGSPSRLTICTDGMAIDAWVSDARYCVYAFASGLGGARQMAFAPNGDLFVNNGNVTVLSDDDHNPRLRGLPCSPSPFGILILMATISRADCPL